MKKILLLGQQYNGGGDPSPWYLRGGIDPSDCVFAHQWKGAASYADAKVNLANPGTYNAYAGSDPSWSAANGITANGTAWLETGVSVSEAHAWAGSLICCMNFPASISGIIFGAFQNAPALWGFKVSNDAGFFYHWPRADYTVAPYSTGVHVLALVANKVYFDGVYVDEMGNKSYLDSTPIRIFTNYNVSSILSAGNLYADAYYDILLSDPQVAAVSSALAAL